jgi:hypothetical protein
MEKAFPSYDKPLIQQEIVNILSTETYKSFRPYRATGTTMLQAPVTVAPHSGIFHMPSSVVTKDVVNSNSNSQPIGLVCTSMAFG